MHIVLVATGMYFLPGCMHSESKSSIAQSPENTNQLPDTVPKFTTMLDEDRYWEIIEYSRQNAAGQDAMEQYLTKEVEKLSLKEIVGFHLRTDRLRYNSYIPELWCAAYIMNGGCSDDCFEYFRCWLISKGKDVFYKANGNPDSLADEVVLGMDYDFEGLLYVAMNAFQNKTGKNIYDYIDYNKFTTTEAGHEPFEFNWQEDDPESMRKICPQLYERLWNK